MRAMGKQLLLSKPLLLAGLLAFVSLMLFTLLTPNLLRSRVAANEASAVGSIRSIQTAAATYQSEHPERGYPQSLAELSPYLDSNLSAGLKSGYEFRLGGTANGFTVEAVPTAQGQTGQRTFATDERGAISYRIGRGAEQLLDGAPTQPQGKASSRRMIRRGSMDFLAPHPQQIIEKIRAVAYDFGGYVDSVRLSDDGHEAQQARIVIRVPVVRLDDVRRKVREIAGNPLRDEDEARDVTAQHVDLQSNLRNFHAEEAQYLEIMQRSGTIKDTLAVAERLADVRGRIERTQGQLDVLSHETEMGLLEIALRTEIVAQPAEIHWHPVMAAKAALSEAAGDLSAYADFMIATAIRLPAFLLWACTLLASGVGGWRVTRWFWRTFVYSA